MSNETYFARLPNLRTNFTYKTNSITKCLISVIFLFKYTSSNFIFIIQQQKPPWVYGYSIGKMAFHRQKKLEYAASFLLFFFCFVTLHLRIFFPLTVGESGRNRQREGGGERQKHRTHRLVASCMRPHLRLGVKPTTQVRAFDVQLNPWARGLKL